jgi:hypothetical protein
MMVDHYGYRHLPIDHVIPHPWLCIDKRDQRVLTYIGGGEATQWTTQIAHQGPVLSASNHAGIADAPDNSEFLLQQIAQRDRACDCVGIRVRMRKDQHLWRVLNRCQQYVERWGHPTLFCARCHRLSLP